MYFVTTKLAPYTLFCMTPSERFAVGLLEDGTVRVLARQGENWKVLHQWNGSRYSHTAFMAALRNREEPATAEELLGLLPPEAR